MRLPHLFAVVTAAFLLVNVTAVQAQQATSRQPSPQTVVTTYFGIANGILRGNSLSPLATVYAPDAILKVSNPKGVTMTFHGLTAITAWYKGWAVAAAGLQLTRDNVRSPMPGMVVDYEHAGNATTPLAARCAHIFAVANGKIVSDDFIVYWGAK